MNTYNKNLNDIYKYLFNKYKFNIRNHTDTIKYEIIKKNNISKKILCHIHCYDIDKFYEIFGSYITNIQIYYSIVVTYSIGKRILDNITLLKIENRGADIGGKICFFKYLVDNSVNFTNVLFLQSKTDPIKRNEYFIPLVGNKDKIIRNISLMETNDAIFNNIHEGYDLTSEYVSNTYYHKDILDYLNISVKDKIAYSEGNCMILSKKIIDIIFINNLNVFYNILNTEKDFDISWVKGRYGKHNISINELYKDFKNNSNYMDLNKNGLAVGNNFGNKNKDMPDGMIEHIFERIYINVINHTNGNYIVVN
jgi:hypothetical protein